tara:strand:+ start:3991 stop:4617 length:627 start_codon:yes stop_codon:yes gene_type:complete
MNIQEFSKIFETYTVKNVYEEIAEHFNVTRVYTWNWISEFINNIPKGSIIYDIGCGNGRNMQFPGYTFIGIDNCEKFIEICRKKNLLVNLSNMTKINLPNNSADAILCIASFHHLYTIKNRIDSLLEMKRLIKSGGKILLSVWSIQQPKKTKVTFNKYGNTMVKWNNKYTRFYYIFKLEEILKLFNDVGLKILDYKYDCGNEIFILSK